MRTAKFIKEITVIDPDSKGKVQLSIYKHKNGGMFAMDSSWLDQCTDENSYPVIRDPFETKGKIMLIENIDLL